MIKNNFGGITKVNLPKITIDFSFKNDIKKLWDLSNLDFLFIVKSWPFIIIVIISHY